LELFYKFLDSDGKTDHFLLLLDDEWQLIMNYMLMREEITDYLRRLF